MTSLVRAGQPDDESLDQLHARMAELDALLQVRTAEVARTKSDLDAFRIRYRKDVGQLHEELDELERAIAKAELGELSKKLADEGVDPNASPAAAQPEAGPRFTTDGVRRLFREVAKTIHPDLASDALTRDHRHRLMVEANRAYAEFGDEERLRRILEAWEHSPEAVRDSDPDATRLRLVRRIAQIEQELDLCAGDLAALKDSPLWKLKAMVDEAAARGKDLVADMVRRLKRDVMAARNRLDAMLWNP